jgi:hypothetical protein
MGRGESRHVGALYAIGAVLGWNNDRDSSGLLVHLFSHAHWFASERDHRRVDGVVTASWTTLTKNVERSLSGLLL